MLKDINFAFKFRLGLFLIQTGHGHLNLSCIKQKTINAKFSRRGVIDSCFCSYYLLHDYDKRVKEKLDEHLGKRDGTRSEIGSMEAL